MFIGRYILDIPVTQQFYIQSLGFLMLLVISSYPLWKILKSSFIPRIALEQNYYWKWIWLVPAFTLIGNMIITMDGEWISSWQQFFARILMAATVVASWKCISLDFEELEEKIRVKNENELLSMQIKSISDSAHVIEEKEEKIKILRHDMRHQMQMLLSFISENENDKALSMIKKLNSELSPISIAKFCQNQIINSAISIYADKAISSSIEVEYGISLPKELPFDENDLAILFANVLDNAVHASLSQAEEKRSIKIKSRYEQNQLVIFVENYFDGIIPFDSKGAPISKKEGHGFGMKSVLSVVKKYNGTAVFTHEDHIFTAGFIFFQL
jgi:signal transduction histidine kinase